MHANIEAYWRSCRISNREPVSAWTMTQDNRRRFHTSSSQTPSHERSVRPSAHFGRSQDILHMCTSQSHYTVKDIACRQMQHRQKSPMLTMPAWLRSAMLAISKGMHDRTAKCAQSHRVQCARQVFEPALEPNFVCVRTGVA